MIYPPAIQRPGPVDKQGYPGLYANAHQGVVCHSMVGYFAGAMIELDKTSRRASWHFSVCQDGRVYQHYDTDAVTWHAGSRTWNGKLIGIEHEGGANPYDEPLTDAQRDASVALVRWLSVECGFPMERGVSLWEHNEVAPPEDPTACPSHRIPWGYYTEEEGMTDELKAALAAIIAQLGALGTKVDALQASTDFLIQVVNNHEPRIAELEKK